MRDGNIHMEENERRERAARLSTDTARARKEMQKRKSALKSGGGRGGQGMRKKLTRR